jgi:hypothetical protein
MELVRTTRFTLPEKRKERERERGEKASERENERERESEREREKERGRTGEKHQLSCRIGVQRVCR